MGECPYCFAEIHDKAVKCPYCNRVLMDSKEAVKSIKRAESILAKKDEEIMDKLSMKDSWATFFGRNYRYFLIGLAAVVFIYGFLVFVLSYYVEWAGDVFVPLAILLMICLVALYRSLAW